MNERDNLKVGEWVEVRSKDEILKTLDENGRLDGLPFMPEMFEYCGQRFRVYKSAHKTCDTVFPIRGRRMADTVHLETRCDGSAHGGCEAGCLIYWKEAWLKPVEATSPNLVINGVRTKSGCTSQLIDRSVFSAESPSESDPTYSCQATQVPYATTSLSPWNLNQYLQDYRSGNVGLREMVRGFAYIFYSFFAEMRTGIGVGRLLRWCYDKTAVLRRGYAYPRKAGGIPIGVRTPVEDLNLQPGELVRVKSYKEILATCDEATNNRGMRFDAEMVPYCGGTYRVLKRVTKIVNEKTGKLMHMKTPCIILDQVVCKARYSECRLFCPRSIYPYWREVWLERVEQPSRSAAGSRNPAGTEVCRENSSLK